MVLTFGCTLETHGQFKNQNQTTKCLKWQPDYLNPNFGMGDSGVSFQKAPHEIPAYRKSWEPLLELMVRTWVGGHFRQWRIYVTPQGPLASQYGNHSFTNFSLHLLVLWVDRVGESWLVFFLDHICLLLASNLCVWSCHSKMFLCLCFLAVEPCDMDTQRRKGEVMNKLDIPFR